jgi:lysozyme
VLKPELDADAMGLVPQETPAPVSASLEGERTQVLRDETPSPGAPPEQPAASPAIAAAEAVTARLRTLFQEPAEAAAEPPFTLEPPSEAEEELGEPAVELVVSEVEEEVRGPDLFEEPAPANDLPEAFPSVVRPDGRPRVVIDDTAPFEYVPPLVQPLPKQPRGGLFALVLLAAVGLAFFAGGIYWALNGRTGAQGGLVSPLLVGWLAGLAGVGFFVAAAFLLLQRLGGASERSSRF